MSLKSWALEHLPLPRSLRSRWWGQVNEKDYTSKLAAARAKNDTEEIESLQMSKQFEEFSEYEMDETEFTRRLVRRARKLRVPLPEYPRKRDEDNDWWSMNYSNGQRYLTPKGIAEVRDAIRKEERWQSERYAQWISGLAGVTGVLGTLIGLFALRCK